MARKSGIIAFSFSRSLSFVLCLTLVLSGVPLPARTQSQQPAPGARTQGPPSPNLPNIETVRALSTQKQPDIKPPAPTRAKRCRHHDKRCQQLKEKKAENRFAPKNDLKGLLAHNRRADKPSFDWRADAGLLPELDFLLTKSRNDVLDSVVASETETENTDRQHLPHAFASSLIPMAALQATNFETARVEPHYRTGRTGEDLFSGNYHWSLPIVSLPGRAGHDLNLTLAYNSLVWTKAGSTLRFDMDYGWPSPGFRFGFPVFYGPYVNSTTNRQAYIVITPSGEAVEMRKVTGYETYEAEDSSYLRLKYDTTLSAWVLTAANGTQFIYGTTLDIKDRNGNRITATYNVDGLMDTITDTLGRQILLEYGEYYELLKVKQVWNGIEKVLAQFDYADQQLYFNFGSLYVDNVTSGQAIPVVSQVTLLDNSRYVFEYSTYGQINKIRRKGGLTFERAWTSYNLPNNSAGQQSDCPLFTTRTDWAYDWSVTAGVATQFLFNQSATNPDAATETTAPTLTYGQVTVPDGTIYKEYTYPSPASMYKWRYGLLKMTDTVAGGILKKRAKTNWEQPCGNGSIGNWTYQCNPRPAETNIYDNTDSDPNTWENRRRVTLAYAAGNPTDFNLVSDVTEYDSNATTVLRSTHTNYNQTSTYQNRRIIGLPTASFLYDGSSALQSKLEYLYDESGYLQATSATPTQHDTTNYGVTFLGGRGNQTTVRRYDVTNQSYVEWKTGYNTTGSPTFSRDPRYSVTGAQTSISYTDKWVNTAGSDTANRNTFAYPTTVTDPDNYSSTIKYDFDLGTVRFTTNPKGAVTMSEYDGYGRNWKNTSGFGSASPFYTSLYFDSSQNYVQSWSSIEANQPDFFSITTFDGHGRTRATVSDHPGSSGQYKGVYRGYDTMGGQTQVSNPTEINSSWNPVGDDTAGWAWSFQTYDWQGRPLVTTNQDNTTSSVSYTGCGCAGGQETTITDEGTVVINPNNGQPETKKRQQKMLHDVLGRLIKTQTLNWENGSPYSTTINSYNVRDQITSVKEYSGNATGTEACPSPTCQITTKDYDEHGRLWKQRRPVETADNIFLYNADDTLWKATDPRNVTATYSYNNRKLVTDIAYSAVPDANLPLPSPFVPRPIPSANATFGYDEAGNRTWMNDAPGRLDYTYDVLSQLKEETRLFDVGGVSRSFTLKYEYNLAGQLKQITDPWNAVVTYNRGKAGQEMSVTATGYKHGTNQDVSAFATNLRYRAWGGIKDFNNGSLSGNTGFAIGYDVRLRLTSFTGGNRTTNHIYYNDGLIKEVSDQHYGSNFLRKYEYDQVSRLTKAHAGGTAQTSSSPYSLTYGYDARGHSTSRQGSHWSSPLPNFSATYVNDRDANMTYDAAGNVKGYSGSTTDPYLHYDATGQLFTQLQTGGAPGLPNVRENYYDGDGNHTNYITFQGSLYNGSYNQFSITYLIRSSVLGGKVVAEFLNFTGFAESDPYKYYSKSYVYLKGVQLAFQEQAHQATGKSVTWVHHNPVVGNLFWERQFNDSSGQLQNLPYNNMTFDPVGTYVGVAEPQPLNIPNFMADFSGQLYQNNYESNKCYADGVLSSCNYVYSALNNGYGQHAPWDNTQSVYNPVTKRNELATFFVDWDNGFYGFVPTGANYHGDGTWSWANNSRPALKPRGTHESIYGRGYYPEPQSMSSQKWEPWVIKNVEKLEKKVQSGNFDGYKNEDNVRYCARLPQDWDYQAQGLPMYPRNVDRWQMGSSLTWGMNIPRGIVIATFDRAQKQYLNNNSGNHTAIFLSFYERDVGLVFKSKERGIWVIEQGPRFEPRYRQIPFDDSAGYFNDAGKYNVVNICPQLKAPSKKKSK